MVMVTQEIVQGPDWGSIYSDFRVLQVLQLEVGNLVDYSIDLEADILFQEIVDLKRSMDLPI